MRNHLIKAFFLAGVAVAPVAAHAQSAIEGRVDRLEGEMRAVQRKVFPGGSSGNFEPQITAGRAATDPATGLPSSSPVVDLTQRVNALEQQLSATTGQIEVLQNKQRLMEDAFSAYKRSSDARLKALEDTASSTTSGIETPAGPSTPAPVRPAPVKPVIVTPKTPNPDAIDPSRARKVAAVEKPDTGNAVEDSYTYGFRLWQAKYYPEAEAQLKSFVAANPRHPRASYAQNLLGRSYLDEGKPSLASIAFYDNYKKMPEGDRAPDSLYYLAQALIKLNKPADACKVYGELSDVYAAKLTEDLKAKIATGRSEAKCK